MNTYTLHLEWPVADVLAYALLRAVDDLEARAVVAEHRDPELGPASAAEYRTAIRRLQTILAQIAPGSRDPDPAQAAVHTLDGTYTIAHGHVVRLTPQPDVLSLIESCLDLISQHFLDPHDALLAIHQHLTDHDHHQHPELPTTRPTSNVTTSTDPQTSSLATPQAAHRLAPGCGPAPDRGPERGAGPC